MIVQILGAKQLSPFVGTSHFVWTAQIAVTLVALACGYYVGGTMADRSPRPLRLYAGLMVAAVYLALTIRMVEPVAYWSLRFSLPVGTFLASTVLFFVPLALLAMTGPFVVRVLASSVSTVGGSVGRLTAIGTLGSFLGTILIGYFMIPLLSNSVAMYVTVAALLLVCGGYFLFTPQKGAMALPVLLAAVCGIIALPELIQAPRFKWVKEQYRANSHFGTLQVLDRPDGTCRYYLNDNLIQNTYAPLTRQSASTFTYMLSGLARAYTTNLSDALCIGLGIGIVPRDFAGQGIRVDVVEINPDIVPMAVKFFDFDPSQVNLMINDARYVLNQTRKQYDAVILDAFLGDSSPSHLMTQEAFTAVRRVLRPGGVLVINAFADIDPGKDFFAGSLYKTLTAVFPGVKLHSNGDGAIFVVATDRPNPEFVRAPDFSQVHPDALRSTERAFATLVTTAPESGRVLTDDYNPVEFYDARNREQVRRRLAEAVKDM